MVAYALSLSLYVIFLNTGKALTGRLGTLLLVTGLVTHYFVLLDRSRGAHTVPYHEIDRKSTRLNSSHLVISYAVFCLKKKKRPRERARGGGPPWQRGPRAVERRRARRAPRLSAPEGLATCSPRPGVQCGACLRRCTRT